MDAKITTTGIDKIQQLLERSQEKLTDFSPLEATIKGIFIEDAHLRFLSSPPVASGGTVYGGAFWKPLSEKSRRRRSKGKILIDSHTLEKSVIASGDANNIFEINGTEVLFGSSVPYANRQNNDRPFLFWHPLLLQKMTAAISTWLVADV